MSSGLQNTSGNIAVNFPQDICCNCGTSEGLSKCRTPLNGISPELPYCIHCDESATRKQRGVIAKILYSILLAPVIWFAGSVIFPISMTMHIGESFLIYSLVLAFIAVFGYTGSRKPRGQQTSYYQPVRIKKVRQKLNGKNGGYAFAFTNKSYEEKFAEANRTAIIDKSIEISRN